MKVGLSAFAAVLLLPSLAFADPDRHDISLPDGSVVVTISDASAHLFAPSTNLRVVVHCEPGPVNCRVVGSDVHGSALLGGVFQGAAGQALRRPDRVSINNSTDVRNENSNENTNRNDNDNTNEQNQIGRDCVIIGPPIPGGGCMAP